MKDSLNEIDSVPFCDAKMLIPKSRERANTRGPPRCTPGLHWNAIKCPPKIFLAWLGCCNPRLSEQMQHKCTVSKIRVSNSKSNPTLSFQQTVADLFQLQGHSFSVYADWYTGWLEVVFKANNADFTTIRRALLAWFSTFGVPEDGGLPFNSQAFT